MKYIKLYGVIFVFSVIGVALWTTFAPTYKIGKGEKFTEFLANHSIKSMIDIDTEGEFFFIEDRVGGINGITVVGYLSPKGLEKLEQIKDVRFIKYNMWSDDVMLSFPGFEAMPSAVWHKFNVKIHGRYDNAMFFDDNGNPVAEQIMFSGKISPHRVAIYVDPKTRRFFLRFVLYRG